MLHNNGRKVEEGGSLETRLSAGEEHAKKKSPIGRHECARWKFGRNEVPSRELFWEPIFLAALQT